MSSRFVARTDNQRHSSYRRCTGFPVRLEAYDMYHRVQDVNADRGPSGSLVVYDVARLTDEEYSWEIQ